LRSAAQCGQALELSFLVAEELRKGSASRHDGDDEDDVRRRPPIAVARRIWNFDRCS
jgi:hypothetical protein